MQRGFTFMELFVVVIIIGILSTLGIVRYSASREHTLDREVFLNLRLIRAAERTHDMDTGDYYPVPPNPPESNITNINQELHLSLSAGQPQSWIYTVYNNGCAQARRNGDDNRIWYFRITDDESDLTDCNFDGEPNRDPANGGCYTCP
jgi:prepilin-type N-terminal cleavage/methylation domain-containing protein